jgi:glycolate oxidase iron-sulfur subunit
VEAFAMTATGCGAVVREYGNHLKHDPKYAAKARRIGELTKDLAEVVAAEIDRLRPLVAGAARPKVAFHPPCSMQHWQKLRGVAEGVLAKLGYELTPIPDVHACCGSAGTYSITQPELAESLKKQKLTALQSAMPDAILTANVGCQAHLATGASVPVRHWVVDAEARLASR